MRTSLPLLFAALFALTCPCSALEGKVVGVNDGDTLTLLDSGMRQHRIRLAEIDAPETGQDYGQRAKQALSRLCFGKHAEVLKPGADRYQRVTGTVLCDGVNANSQMVKEGWAWVYVQYASKSSPLFELERAARIERIGLWASPGPVAPWEWRRARRTAPQDPASERATGSALLDGGASQFGVRGNRRSNIYHLSHCPDHASTSPRNRIDFASEQSAIAAGFRRAANCR